jgi:hypothetical protein
MTRSTNRVSNTRRVGGSRSGGRVIASASPRGSLVGAGEVKHAYVACSDDAARFPRAVPARASETNERRGGMTLAIKGGLAAAIAAAALTLTPPLALAEDATVAVPQETAPAAPASSTSSSSSPDTPTAAPVEAAPTSPSVSVSPPSVPSGTYPLASSAPLPSELKKMEKDAAAKDAKEGNKDGTKSGGGGGEGKKQSKSARLEELNQMRLELDLKEIEVRQKTQELVKQEQTSATIQEELELARKLNGILQAELDRVKEETKLASGLCAQVGGF